MRFEELVFQNPWWEDPNAVLTDRNIENFEQAAFKFYPEKILSKISTEKPGIYTLRGPRQVGKTTLLKLFLRNLLNVGIEPVRILFANCEIFTNWSELIESYRAYHNAFKAKISGSINYVLLDEITSVPEWQRAVKYLADVGMLSNSVVLLTGSSAYDLKHSSERMPGRKGVGRDLVLLPLSFKEFLTAQNFRPESYSLEELMSLSKEELEALVFKHAYAKLEFERYLISGGFPLAINAFLSGSETLEASLSVYTDFVLGDAYKYIRSRKNILELLSKIPDIIGQRISWNSLVDIFSTTIESVDTIQKYFEFLSCSFIVSIVYHVDPNQKTPRPKKLKKIYPIDKIIVDVLSRFRNKTIESSRLVEIAVLRALLETNPVLNEGLDLVDGPFYWYSERGNEIDFIVRTGDSLVPIEVKYQNKITPADYLGMKKVFGKGIILTKDTVLSDEHVRGLPAWLFLTLFGD